MLFNSYEFILAFLPLTLLLFFQIGARGHHRIAIAWLVGASLFFYAWWNPAYLGLMLGSILFNYAIGVALGNTEEERRNNRRALLWFGISANLALLGYFKYANFFVDNLNLLLDNDIQFATIILPLAISFFTFQQISYLVDAYQHKTREYNFLHYSLFVTFFPQLIAGPIVHHRDMLPQFAKDSIYRPNPGHLAVGLTIFFIGLAKKVIIADSLAPFASEAFNAAASGALLTLFEAWRATLAYTFQLYFDFSGYSDMAIGLSYMFGIVLPLNFDSPYKAVNIIDFWRRWHMTLSRFLRDYVYIPLGGNRRGPRRRQLNLLLTMLIGGLWHGAAWSFVLWGGLHGVYLIINHAWHALRRLAGLPVESDTRLWRWSGRLLTFIAVAFAWVLFRADTPTVAWSIMQGMLGLNGIVWPHAPGGAMQAALEGAGWQFTRLEYFKGAADLAVIALLLLIVWLAPNSQEIMGPNRPALDSDTVNPARRLRWQPTTSWAMFIALLAIAAVLKLSSVSEFLYFRF